ncbi:MAG: TIM barrel protein [Clostridia bacterium]|nr:TIM barrel protein [Clostridia bacterium]
MLRIGPAGNSASFYASGHKKTVEEPEWLHSIGLTAFEYSFGRGITMSDETAQSLGSEALKHDIAVSVHAPYYINFANPSDDMILKSIDYVVRSVQKVKLMNGNRVVFHPAACGKDSREVAFARTVVNVGKLAKALENILDFDDYIVCPETMGKMQQIGRVEEVIELCKLDKHFYPCYDFGHINSYSQGALKGIDDYRRIIDLTYKELGEEKASHIHIHFSKIEYGKSGEIRHLTFDDTVFGPDYEPLAKIIDEYDMHPVIICESQEKMADDALLMKKCHKNI